MNSEKLTDNTELEADNTESTEAVNTEPAAATEGGENAAEAESSASGEENDPFAEVSSLNEWDHSQLIMGFCTQMQKGESALYHLRSCRL